jgi:hypothetical protein
MRLGNSPEDLANTEREARLADAISTATKGVLT